MSGGGDRLIEIPTVAAEHALASEVQWARGLPVKHVLNEHLALWGVEASEVWGRCSVLGSNIAGMLEHESRDLALGTEEHHVVDARSGTPAAQRGGRAKMLTPI